MCATMCACACAYEIIISSGKFSFPRTYSPTFRGTRARVLEMGSDGQMGRGNAWTGVGRCETLLVL